MRNSTDAMCVEDRMLQTEEERWYHDGRRKVETEEERRRNFARKGVIERVVRRKPKKVEAARGSAHDRV
jgi:hypothetical protein